MGMYDSLKINLDKLPLNDDEKKRLGKDHWFQTKDFDCRLTEIYITDDGKLQINHWKYEAVPVEERPYPNEKGLLGMCGSLRRTGEHLETIEHHGYVNFYTLDKDDKWYEFNAKFTNGTLDSIERVPEV